MILVLGDAVFVVGFTCRYQSLTTHHIVWLFHAC